MQKVKISQLTEAESLTGLYTIGTDADNRSVKVGLEFVQTKVSDAVAAAEEATKDAKEATTNAEEATKDAKEATTNAEEATKDAKEATTNAETATKDAADAADAANDAADAANDAAEAANTAVNNISAKVERTDTGATVTVTDADGTVTSAELTNGADGADGKDGEDGKDGADGVSPTVEVKETESGVDVKITDAEGEKSFSLTNGKDGDTVDLDVLYSNVFIVYNSSSTTYLAKLSQWPDLQELGYVALGVCIAEGGRFIVVAPGGGNLSWPSSTASVGTLTDDRAEALADMDGKSNTEKQCNAVFSSSSTPPGFCHSYSRSGKDSYGYPAGNWWLPSLGELMMICTNIVKINYALSLIDGATQLNGDIWSGTRDSTASKTWCLNSANYAVMCLPYGPTFNVRPITEYLDATAI